MTSTQHLEKIALARRKQFNSTLQDIKARAAFPAIAHDTLGLLNLRRKGPALVVAGAVAGVVWLSNKFLMQNRSRIRHAPKPQP
jgi:hypothetical protein